MHGKLYRISDYTPAPPPTPKKDEDTSKEDADNSSKTDEDTSAKNEDTPAKNDEYTPKQDPKVYGFPLFLILNWKLRS